MQFRAALLDGLQEFASLVFTIAGALLFSVALVVLGLASIGAWRRSRKIQVSIPVLVDGTGDPRVAAATAGMTHQLQEKLVTVLPKLARRVQQMAMSARKDPTGPLALLFQDSEMDQRLLDLRMKSIEASQSELIESVQSIMPSTARAPFLVIATSLLRPKEIRIAGVLQERSRTTGGIGISFDVSRVDGVDADNKVTVWEDRRSPEVTSPGVVEDQPAAADLVERFYDLIDAAARVVACELLRQQLVSSIEHRSTRVLVRRVLSHARGLAHRRPASRATTKAVELALVDVLIAQVYNAVAHGSRRGMTSCYRLAEKALTKAQSRVHHHKVLYDLAGTKAELARRERDRDDQATLLVESTKLFAQAEAQIRSAGADEQEKLRGQSLRIKSKSCINRSLLATMFPEDEQKAERAVAEATTLLAVRPSDYADDTAAQYNLACALAVAAGSDTLAAHGLDQAGCLLAAKRAYLHACAADSDWWADGPLDQDLRLLHRWIPRAHRCMLERTEDEESDPGGMSARVDAVLDDLAARPERPVN